MKIELHIDELVLHGFSPHDRARIGDALETALVGQLAIHAYTATRDAAVDRVDAGSIALPAGSTPAAVGGAIAGAIAGAVRKVS